MRGSPLIRGLLAFLAILSLGYPLRHLTTAKEPARPVATATPPPAAAPREISLRLSFATAPESVKVLHLGKEVWTENAPQTQLERTLQLRYPKDGIDLRFSIVFPEGTALTAMRVQFTDPSGDEHEKSLWGTGSIDDVLSFP